ncbi:MAG: type I methionyl aminopeptidase [Candidatus Aminicenantes bacterium]|mgnify:CR=1 FL=1|nr:MAG: type I methionyl aminopeptidase [Candidatus Aminicenantes bacterium]RLE02830.1 MAG: type I methionyl aminopeptidase [Candidatus Aminicenantes bacterium]HHF43282.1 type I methionyl aminopeptidase [Candidatus Aminicenantes bacterium]
MIIYKSPQEIKMMRESARLVGQILQELKAMIRPGLKTIELDKYAEKRTKELGAEPAFKGYRGYPASLCVSINEEIIHGIPSERRLKEGDLVSLDFGVVYKGFYGDAALTCPVGEVSEEAQRLLAAAEGAFWAGVEYFKEGNYLSDISHAIQTYVEERGFSVIRSFVGHGIGYDLHEDPQLPNYGAPHHGPRLKPGLVLAIEPMIAAGGWEVEILSDGWTAITKDRSLAAHYEHTVALTERGPQVLSLVSEEEEAIAREKGVHYA